MERLDLKGAIRNILKILVYKLRFIIIEVMKEVESEESQKLLSEVGESGLGIQLNGKVRITHPDMVLLGNNIHIGENAHFHTDGGLKIGDNVHISRNVTIYTSDHDYNGEVLPYDNSRIYKPVHIHENVWIGMNVCICPGVKIGKGAIIGMGTVVTKDVPSLAIVGNAPIRVIKSRDEQHYNDLQDYNKIGGVNGIPLDKKSKLISGKSVFDLGESLFFIVSTGRSGSKSIADTISQHPDAECKHEPKGELIRLSTEYAHGLKDRNQVKQELISLYSGVKNVRTDFYGESDQKLANLIDILHEIFPKAKFIWIMRDARDFVSSAYGRGWFDDREYGYPTRQDLCVDKIHSAPVYSKFRLNGSNVANEFTPEEWKAASPFERNCWYWTYWNNLIESQFAQLPETQKLQIQVETIRTDEISDFLGLPKYNLEVLKSNTARHEIAVNWSTDQEEVFEKRCSAAMKNWYK